MVMSKFVNQFPTSKSQPPQKNQEELQQRTKFARQPTKMVDQDHHQDQDVLQFASITVLERRRFELTEYYNNTFVIKKFNTLIILVHFSKFSRLF